MSDKYLTLGKVALHLSVQEHQIRALARRNLIPHAKAGSYRIFDPADLPAIRDACVRAGYLAADKGQEVASC